MFNYPEFVAENYKYREAVENNNSLKHDGVTKSQTGL